MPNTLRPGQPIEAPLPGHEPRRLPPRTVAPHAPVVGQQAAPLPPPVEVRPAPGPPPTKPKPPHSPLVLTPSNP
jgi:large subunit ribosomal protein L24